VDILQMAGLSIAGHITTHYAGTRKIIKELYDDLQGN
jgi:hypothetical protein